MPSTPDQSTDQSPDHAPTFPFDNSYARLPDRFFTRTRPTAVAAPRLIQLNENLARELRLDPVSLTSLAGIAILAGNTVAPGSEPIATAYAGHQFGGFNPSLGDGRAILLGEVVDACGIRRDIQLKGSGPTHYSRRGDGRAALGPVLREYILSEAFASLGVPSTRALAAVSTGEVILRERALPGAVLTRIAQSHIRVGTFQYFAARSDVDAVRALADHVIARHYIEAAAAPNPYLAMFDAVVARQATLIARWMNIGFIHGVMNTDNMAICGETIDFGPCAFVDHYEPDKVFSSIDERGRYALSNQPAIGLWNLSRLAEALLPLLADDKGEAINSAEASLGAYVRRYEEAYLAGLRQKLGFVEPHADDLALAQDLLDAMAAAGADFTQTFRRLTELATDTSASEKLDDLRKLFADTTAIDLWIARWLARIAVEASTPAARAAIMRRANPVFIPRNHLVAEAIAEAVENDDFGAFERLLRVLSRPYDDQPEFARYALPPKPEEVVRATFCGT
ncbi:MAG: hypothetical protein CTY20_07335 [Hyphomicrobium sp.]|nr:MAG: hypothetical protein CTY20_07335 [Hyphomicrobium sp.]